MYILMSGTSPLETFPLLLEATPQQRAKFGMGIDDDDIHISSFFETAEPDTNIPFQIRHFKYSSFHILFVGM